MGQKVGHMISKSEGKLWDIDIKTFRVSLLKNLSRALQGPFHLYEITKSLAIDEKAEILEYVNEAYTRDLSPRCH